MSEDPNQPKNSQQDTKASEPPVIDTPATNPKRMPPKAQVTPQGVFNALWIIMQLGILCMLGILYFLVYLKLGWPGVWKITLLGTCGLFAIMSLLVIVGGALDVRKLLRRLREQENEIQSKTID
jgi:hypothetical protein|tara:strand:- start:3459 stop:3830 length:372 start_codon:yes stop_codon:yes gene_type:complete